MCGNMNSKPRFLCVVQISVATHFLLCEISERSYITHITITVKNQRKDIYYMKKIFKTIFFVFILLISLCCIHAFSSTVSSGTCGEKVSYTLDDKGTLTISGTGEMYDLGSSGFFYKNTNIKNIIIESGVTYIGNYAFYGCSNLTSVSIPDSVISFGTSAFGNCSSLNQVNISDLKAWCNIDFKNISDNPLWYAQNLYLNGSLVKDLIIPDDITSINNYTFARCSNLESITIPDSLISIGTEAFANCTNLTRVNISDLSSWCNIKFAEKTSNPAYCAQNLYLNGILVEDLIIPDGVTSINDYAFYGYSKLTSITFPKGVSSIGEYAFFNCDNLTNLSLSDSVTAIGAFAFAYCEKITNITIPKSVTSFGTQSFYNCSLNKVEISDLEAWCNIDFETYLANPLYYAHNLYLNGSLVKSVTIPVSRTTIKNYTFSGCSSLTSIDIPDSVTEIGIGAFYYCSKLTSITIPDSVTVIKNITFGYCSNLKNITIPDTVTAIGSGAFSKCIKLAEISIPAGVTSIESSTFSGCTNLTKIAIPNSVTYIGSDAFFKCSKLTDIIIPEDVTYIGSQAFWDCSNLKSINIPNNLTSISASVFCGCTGLTSVIIPDGVNSIGMQAFSGVSLTIVIPKSVTSLGKNSLNKATGIYYEGSENEWNSITRTGAFGTTENSNIIFYDVASERINKNIFWTLKPTGELIIWGSGTIPSFTSVSEAPFTEYIEKIKYVKIPNNIQTIGDFTFANCSNLQFIEISANVENIGKSAFKNCSNLKKVFYTGSKDSWNDISIAEENIYLKEAAFFCNCINSGLAGDNIFWFLDSGGKLTVGGLGNMYDFGFLSKTPWYANRNTVTSVEIESGVERIGNYALSNLPTTIVSIPNTVTSIGKYAFYSCGTMTNIIIPDSVILIEENAFALCTTLKEVLLSNNLEVIPKSLFSSSGLESINIPKNVKEIKSSAFSYCSKLVNITLPDSLVSIEDSSFQNCSNLVKIVFTKNLKYISQYAFSNCSKLTDITIPNNVEYIDRYAFSSCTNLKRLIIIGNQNTEYGTEIESYAFYNCTNLTDIIILGKIRYIESNAFYNCQKIENLKLGKDILSINSYAFRNCSAPKNLYYGKTEDKFIQMLTQTGNTAILGAEYINFNSTFFEVLNGSTNETTVVFETPDTKGATVNVAAFLTADRISETEKITVNTATFNDSSNAQYFKVFIWDDNMNPVLNSLTAYPYFETNQ